MCSRVPCSSGHVFAGISSCVHIPYALHAHGISHEVPASQTPTSGSPSRDGASTRHTSVLGHSPGVGGHREDIMCGFAAMIALSGGQAARATVDAMAATLVHRGPDDEGSYV